VTTSSWSPEELRAAAETHRELGPDYRDAVIDSFLDKVGKEIDARVDARMAYPQQFAAAQQFQAAQQLQAPAKPARPAGDKTFALAIVSIALGIPISAICVAAGNSPPGVWGLLIAWLAIAVINVSYGRRH